MKVLTLQEQIEVLVEAKKIYKYDKIDYNGVGKIRPLGLCHAIKAAIDKLHNEVICSEYIDIIIPIFNGVTAKFHGNATNGDMWKYWWPVFITESQENWENGDRKYTANYYAKQLRNAKPRLEFLDWCIAKIEEDIVYKEKLDKLYKEVHQHLSK